MGCYEMLENLYQDTSQQIDPINLMLCSKDLYQLCMFIKCNSLGHSSGQQCCAAPHKKIVRPFLLFFTDHWNVFRHFSWKL